MSAPLAWTVATDEASCVVFTSSRGRARVLGGRELGLDPRELGAERASHFDAYAPGPVPVSALLDAGWWYECGHCYHRVDADGCNDCADEGEGNEMPALVATTYEVFCSSECHAVELEERRLRREGKARSIAAVLERFPEAQDVSVWQDPEGVWHALFGLPGMQGRVSWEEGSQTVLAYAPDVPLVREADGRAGLERWESDGGAP